MSDETTLLPCPFCGGEAKVMQADHPSYTPHSEGWYVICGKCRATLGYHGTDELYMTYGDFASELGAIEAWNARAMHSTLTAEQVRETVLKHGNVMGPRFYGDWQAIANELNAELGSGTCEWLPVESCHAFAGPGWECSNCGYEVGEYEHDFYNCCPICCAKVMDE